MSLFKLVWSYLKARPLNTAINIALLSLGISVIVILLLMNNQIEQKISQNSKGIDLVVGAKGSPLQLILCNIFHIDFPTGNIKLFEADRIAKSRHVKKAIPMALGDAYHNYRIIGTTHDYAELYKAEIDQGQWWSNDLEVTIGHNVQQLKLDDSFSSAHGLTMGGHDHEGYTYKVVGIMKQTNSILDDLILTNIGSIWLIHDEHHDSVTFSHSHEQSIIPSKLVPTVSALDSTKEITSMLIQYRTALAAIQLPRSVNAQSSLQAASPAFETARLFTILGVGVDVALAFAYVLILMSALSIFIALYNSLKERKYDMSIMRSMGAGRGQLFAGIILEGSILTLLGTVIGLTLGHFAIFFLSTLFDQTRKAGISGFIFYPEEWILLGGSLLLGVLCSVIPAVQAYKTDISRTLASSH